MHIYKEMFVISDKSGKPDFNTISFLKDSSIEYFLKGSSMTWKEAYKLGYRCRKYDVTFTLKKKQ